MAIKYDLYQNPPKKNNTRKPRMHARVVTENPANTENLVKLIHSRCTLTESDIRATLCSLKDAMVDLLQEGRQVHIDGLGYFNITLDCPSVKSAEGVRAEVIRFKNVTFRAEQKLKDEFTSVHFERAAVKKHSNAYSDIEIDDILTKYFMDNNYITRKTFQQIAGLRQSTASRRLTNLVVEGKLIKEGIHKFPIYTPAKGHYRK